MVTKTGSVIRVVWWREREKENRELRIIYVIRNENPDGVAVRDVSAGFDTHVMTW
jgi:hypothetical protein